MITLGIVLVLLIMSGLMPLRGQEIRVEDFRQRRAMIRPAGKVIFDFRPRGRGFIVVIVNYGDTDFTFRPEEITFRQGKKRWTPIYMTIAAGAVDFPLQFNEDVMPNTIRKYGRSEKVTIEGGNWQTLEELQVDLQNELKKGLRPFCYLEIEEPLPDYTKPLDIRVKRIGKSVVFNEGP